MIDLVVEGRMASFLGGLLVYLEEDGLVEADPEWLAAGEFAPEVEAPPSGLLDTSPFLLTEAGRAYVRGRGLELAEAPTEAFAQLARAYAADRHSRVSVELQQAKRDEFAARKRLQAAKRQKRRLERAGG